MQLEPVTPQSLEYDAKMERDIIASSTSTADTCDDLLGSLGHAGGASGGGPSPPVAAVLLPVCDAWAPAVDKYTQLAYPPTAVKLALAMHGDDADESKVRSHERDELVCKRALRLPYDH